jgi:hypothetical protein
MAQKTDWLPSDRAGQLAQCRDWLSVLTAGSKAAAWSVPQSRVTELESDATAAETALATARTETTRTPVATAACRTAFHAMTELMRDTKHRYFLTPPLIDPTDYVSLGLKPHDKTHTTTGTPTAQVMIETYLVGRHELGIKIVYVTGDPNDPANKGFRIYYKVVAPGSAAPTAPGELIKSFYTKRKKDVMEFEFGDSGKTAFFAVQIENEGKKGPWGPMVSALIP